MIFPDILLGLIPDILEVLSHIEGWRIKVVKLADRALVSDEYWPNYKLSYPSGLTDDDRRVLQGIVDTHDAARGNYIEIAKQFCSLVRI